jgi:tripartite-type tricarboxylate transporter receptor subunit TctC
MTMRFLLGLFGAAVVAQVALATPATAQDYPNKPIRILVPYAAGGFVDVAARIVGARLSEVLGQQVVIENRPGGRGHIATRMAARATPDGYTLLMAHTGEFSVSPVIFKDVPYDFDRDFHAITLVSDAPMVIGAHAGSPYKTMADLIAAAKAKPGVLGMGTPGVGSINHLTGAWIELVTGAKFLHVPYKGGAPAATAAASGEIPFGVAALSSTQPQIDAGLVRVLAVTTPTRSPVNMSWPTLKEAGVPEVATSIWTGLFAPKGVPQPILDRIYSEVAKLLATKDVQDRFAAGGAVTGGMSPAEFTAKIRRDTERYREIVKQAKIEMIQ